MSGERFKLRAAVYLLLINDGKVLLSKRQNTGWEDGNYTLVSGHIDGSESVIDAMIREAKEEIGIKIRPDDLKVVGVMHRKANHEYVDFFLTVDKWDGDVKNMEPDICEKLSLFEIGNLPSNIVESMRIGLENYQNNVFFSEVGF